MWHPHHVAFSCQPYLLQPNSGRVMLLQEHVLHQKCGKRSSQDISQLQLQHLTRDGGAGDVYLSSPSLFLHRVRYPACAWYAPPISPLCCLVLSCMN